MTKKQRVERAHMDLRNQKDRARRAKKKRAALKAAYLVRKMARREALVLAHTHVVLKIAQQVHRHMTHVDVQDLEQAGYCGLLEAADRYKPRSGPFENYAYFRVRGAMIDAHKRVAYRNETHQSLEELQSTDYGGGTSHQSNLPRVIAIDSRPLPEAMAAKREQARLLARAVQQLDRDEQIVFLGALEGVPLIQTARDCDRSIAWARAKLASARARLGATVQMWGLGLEQAA